MSIENELNDEWINNFEKADELYQDFYKDDLYYINLKFVYINKINEVDKIKTETFLMSKPNCISKEEIIEILKKNARDNLLNYSLLSILKYNITLDADDIKLFINSTAYDSFLKVIKHIDVIPFEKTISMMQDLNDLIVIFYEKTNKQKQKTNANNITKKFNIYLNAHKKTIKKQYKD